jgi:hypothetical protein
VVEFALSRLPIVNHETEIVIAAPRPEVWSHLIDFERHGEWSTTFALRGQAKIGERGRVLFHLFGIPSTYPISLVTIDEARELRWEGGPHGIMQGSHYFRLEPDGPIGDRTRFIHGEDFSGVAVPLLWPVLLRVIGPAYEGFNQELKRRVERPEGAR